MDIKIIISDLISNGLSEKNGFLLREKILEHMKNNNENLKIVLDFTNITLFATPFFNSFIGYFVLNFGPEKVTETIKIENITPLGYETYTHSYNNAVYIYNRKIDVNQVGQITKNNIENS